MEVSLWYRRKSSTRIMPARDLPVLWKEIEMAKERFGLPADAPVVSCYEAGRDGFWLHRYLIAHGVQNIVVDSSSIEVSRRKRRAKTDRLDAKKLYKQLVRHLSGEEKVWSVVRPPSLEDEDERRIHREIGRLQKEINGHGNRILSLLILHGIELKVSKFFLSNLERARPLDGSALGPELKRELVREYDRWKLASQQLAELRKVEMKRIRAVAKETQKALRDADSKTRLTKAPVDLHFILTKIEALNLTDTVAC